MKDPFAMGLFGGSPKTAICACGTFIDGTTVHESQSAVATLLSGQDRKLSFALTAAEPLSSGDAANIGKTVKSVPSARFSETKQTTSRRSLSDKLTLSLISYGLVKGITPSSTRKQSGQPILVLALDTPDGSDAAKQQRDSSSLSGKREMGR